MTLKNKLPLHTSFVIIGAGAAGLTAAQKLLEAGYQQITILEAASQAGGKCRSFQVDNLSFDLGAIIGVKSMYQPLLTRSKKYGLATQAMRGFYIDPINGDIARMPESQASIRLYWEGLKYASLLSGKFRNNTAETVHLNSELCLSLSELAERYKLTNLELQMRPILAGMGYGFAEALPAAYTTQMIPLPYIVRSAIQDQAFFWPAGTQKIWQCEAAELEEIGVNILYNARVQKIMRGDVVRIWLENSAEPLSCDELIVACDPRLVQLDASAAEQGIFSKIQNVDYRVLVTRIEGLPKANAPSAFCLQDNLTQRRAGHPMMLVQKYPEQNIYLSYAFGTGLSQQEIKDRLATDVEAIGGRVTEYLHYQEWRNYFPHFAAASIQEGVFAALQQLQGQHHTSFVGEWTTVAMLPHIITHTESTIQKLLAGYPFSVN